MNKLFQQPVEQRSYSKGIIHNFYIFGEVSVDINEYVDMITTLDMADEQDEVHIYLNTPGGSLDTTISLVHAIGRTKAHVITHADGQVASAGTVLFLAGHSFVISPYCHFMCHDGSSGSVGKFNENLKNAVATSNLIRKIYFNFYSPYFTDEEIEDILEGKDFYCDADELLDRVERGMKIKYADELDDGEHTAALGEITEIPFDEGDYVEVSNISLVTHGERGVVIEIKSENIRKVELDSGRNINVHIKNLVMV